MYSDRSQQDLSDGTYHQNSKIPFQSKVMMKKLLKINEIASLRKCS